MVSTIAIKKAKTNTALHPLITKRWSPRSFADQAITQEQLAELFEAARWSASANNEQPWEYRYALKGTEGFEKLWNCLLPGNQPWTQQAAVLIVALKRKTFAGNGNPNPWADHDLGLANAQLFIQATYRDIYGHMMAGFDQEKTKNTLQLSDDIEPVCFMALGYLGAPEALEEPYLSRELAPRSRKSVKEFTREI